MLWIGIGITVVTCVVIAVILARHPVDGAELGSVSAHWIAEHHVDVP